MVWWFPEAAASGRGMGNDDMGPFPFQAPPKLGPFCSLPSLPWRRLYLLFYNYLDSFIPWGVSEATGLGEKGREADVALLTLPCRSECGEHFFF